MYSVILQNIKGIKELTFPFPQNKGIYVLTGVNGCGKTSLLVALCRIGDNMAFKAYQARGNNRVKIDMYKDAAIVYKNDTRQVKYQRKGIRWVPTPREQCNLIASFPFVNTIFVSTMGMRFFSQDLFEFKRVVFNAVSSDIISPMNEILGTSKFTNLFYITVKNKRGRQRTLHRNNKLYVIRDEHNIYSEQNFSLGERLLLNTLDTLEHIPQRTLLLIDEVELALHPIAQVKFYEYLKVKAQEKNLAIIISTHSSSLIKHADHLLFLEKNEDRTVHVLENCYPSYILRDVASNDEQKPDYIFLVEDTMARTYLDYILRKFINDLGKVLICKVIKVGGYEQVVHMLKSMPSLGFKKTKVQAFLDHDVLDTYNDLVAKGANRTESENKKLLLFSLNALNISYLSITPELGVWQWGEQNPNKVKQYFDTHFGILPFDVKSVIHSVIIEEAHNKTGNLRNWAKGCFKNFSEKVNNYAPDLSKERVIDALLFCYVDNTYDVNTLKRVLLPIFNRK